MNLGGVFNVEVIKDIVDPEQGGHSLNLCITFFSEAGVIVPADRAAGTLLVAG
jgi:hypothetical protein